MSMWHYIQHSKRGFTLLEILVVVSIIGILVTAGVATIGRSSPAARDAERQANLRNLQAAIEVYKNQNGRYPAGCNGADAWSGQPGTLYACSSGVPTEYIIGLAPTYIPRLPFDSKLNGTDSGYRYRTNAAGTVYKLTAHRTVESETVTFTHPMKSCDVRVDPGSSASLNRDEIGWCTRLRSNWATSSASWPQGTTQYTRPHATICNLTGNPTAGDAYTKSYAVWGGFLPLRYGAGYVPAGGDVCGSGPTAQVNCHPSVVLDTINVICR